MLGWLRARDPNWYTLRRALRAAVVVPINFAIGSQLSNRVLHTSRKVSRLAFMDVTSRVAKTLIDLCSEPDSLSHPRGTQIRISRQEISRIVGCSREMVGRVLKQLEEEGMITVSGKTIVVLGTR